MLCDELMDAGPMGYHSQLMAATIDQVRLAQKFVLDPPFAAAADALSADYGTLVKAFPFCRLPFAHTWIEVAQGDRPQFMAAGVHAPIFQSRPRRVGFLCTATRSDLSAWKSELFWVMPDKGCNAAAIAMNFDMTQGSGIVYDSAYKPYRIGQEHQEFFPESKMKSHPGWDEATPVVRQALLEHTGTTLPDYGTPMFPEDITQIPRPKLDKILSMIYDLARSDWAGEVSFLLAVIGLLNARNVVERERVDVSRKSHARIKRGRPAFFEHHLLKIQRRQITRAARAPGTDQQHGKIRRHVCAGHWKVRKTGIFFWHPFWRGDPARGTVTKDYEVVR